MKPPCASALSTCPRIEKSSDRFLMGTLFFPVLIPFRFLRDRRKKWDQSVGPNSGIPLFGPSFSSVWCLIIHILPSLLWNASMAKLTWHSASEREQVGSIPGLSPSTFFFPHFGSKRSKRRLDILEENRRLIHCFSFRSNSPIFLLKSGTNHHQPHHWIIVGFSWIIFPGSFAR